MFKDCYETNKTFDSVYEDITFSLSNVLTIRDVIDNTRRIVFDCKKSDNVYLDISCNLYHTLEPTTNLSIKLRTYRPTQEDLGLYTLLHSIIQDKIKCWSE